MPEGFCGVPINWRNNADWEFDDGGGGLNRWGRSDIPGSILIGLVAAIAVDGDIIEWSWLSTLSSSLSACVNNFGYFLGLFCECSSFSFKRFKFVLDVCRVVRRSAIGDSWSRLFDESNKASSEPSDKTDWGVRQLGVARR